LFVNVAIDGAFGLDRLYVKSTVDGDVTVTPIDAVLDPSAFVAVIVTMYVPGAVNV
jgi:hypothetical protein